MRESHGEGVATHTGPESIRRSREVTMNCPRRAGNWDWPNALRGHGRPPSQAVLNVLDEEKLSPSDDQFSDRDQQ